MNVDYEGLVENCVQTFGTKIKQFLFHVFVKRQQSNFFELLKNNSTNERCLLQVDYSENFSLVEQNEIRSAHWSRGHLSIFTAHVWAGTSTYPMIVVSDDPAHNKYTVVKCLEHVLSRLKKLLPLVKQVDVFSDGSASQFKQRYLFKNLSYLANDFDVGLSWNFFASHHGKGKRMNGRK